MNNSRFKKLTNITCNTDLIGCGVEFVKGSLLKDTDTGYILAQLKYRNISGQQLNSLYISIKCFDEMGIDLLNGKSFSFAYQDLNVINAQEFADRIPVYLPDIHIRKVEITIEKYMLQNGDVIFANNYESIVLPSIYKDIPLDLKTELARIIPNDLKSGYKTITFPFEYENGWICSCGKYNEADKCVRCKNNKIKQFEIINYNYITNSLNDYKKHLKEEKSIKEIKIKNALKKATKIAIPIVIIIVIFAAWLFPSFITPAIKYNKANIFFKDHKYKTALSIFKELNDYKDSKTKVTECIKMYEKTKTGTFTEDIEITVNKNLSAEWIYSTERTEKEKVNAQLTVKYVNGKMQEDNVTITFTGYDYYGTKGGWNTNSYKYVGEYIGGTITGNGKLYRSTDNLIYDGEFKNGAFSGYGKFYQKEFQTENDIIFLDGTWKNGNIEGNYIRYYMDGTLNDRGTCYGGIGNSDKYGKRDYR